MNPALLPENIQTMMHHFSTKKNDASDITTLTRYLTSTPSFSTEILHTALQWGNLEVLKLLIFHKANVNHCSGPYHTPALHAAVKSGDVEIVRLLLQNRASTQSMDATKDTALHRAAAQGYLAIAKVLLANGASVDAPNILCETPLHYAIRYKHADLAADLLKKGANVNAQNTNGRSSLHIAASQGNRRLVLLLRHHGANLNLLDHNQQTPEACARAQHPEIADLIVTPKKSQFPACFAFLHRGTKKSPCNQPLLPGSQHLGQC